MKDSSNLEVLLSKVEKDANLLTAKLTNSGEKELYNTLYQDVQSLISKAEEEIKSAKNENKNPAKESIVKKLLNLSDIIKSYAAKAKNDSAKTKLEAVSKELFRCYDRNRKYFDSLKGNDSMKHYKIGNKIIVAKDAVDAVRIYRSHKTDDMMVKDFDDRIIEPIVKLCEEYNKWSRKVVSEYANSEERMTTSGEYVKVLKDPKLGTANRTKGTQNANYMRSIADKKLKELEARYQQIITNNKTLWYIFKQEKYSEGYTLESLIDNACGSSTTWKGDLIDINKVRNWLKNKINQYSQKREASSQGGIREKVLQLLISSGLNYKETKFNPTKGTLMIKFNRQSVAEKAKEKLEKAGYPVVDEYEWDHSIWIKMPTQSLHNRYDSLRKDAEPIKTPKGTFSYTGETAENLKNKGYDLWFTFGKYDIYQNHKTNSKIAVLKDSIKDVDPREGESKDDFLNRFMSETEKEYPDKKQRFAVALKYWNKANDSIRDSEIEGIYQCKNNEVIEIRYDNSYNKFRVSFQKGGSPIVVNEDAALRLIHSYNGYKIQDSVKDSKLISKIWNEEDFKTQSAKSFWENYWKQGLALQNSNNTEKFMEWIDNAIDYAETDLVGYIREEVIKELQSAKLSMRDSVNDATIMYVAKFKGQDKYLNWENTWSPAYSERVRCFQTPRQAEEQLAQLDSAWKETFDIVKYDYDNRKVLDSVRDSVYTFPKLSSEDIRVGQSRYGLKFANNGEDTYATGTYSQIKKFAKEYLDYEINPDYLEDSTDEDFNEDD